jgi:hypothetical protein
MVKSEFKHATWTNQEPLPSYSPPVLVAGGTTVCIDRASSNVVGTAHPGWALALQAALRSTSPPLGDSDHQAAATDPGVGSSTIVGTSLIMFYVTKKLLYWGLWCKKCSSSFPIVSSLIGDNKKTVYQGTKYFFKTCPDSEIQTNSRCPSRARMCGIHICSGLTPALVHMQLRKGRIQPLPHGNRWCLSPPPIPPSWAPRMPCSDAHPRA